MSDVRQFYGYTWSGVIQEDARGIPYLYKSRGDALKHRNARCKVVMFELRKMPDKRPHPAQVAERKTP